MAIMSQVVLHFFCSSLALSPSLLLGVSFSRYWRLKKYMPEEGWGSEGLIAGSASNQPEGCFKRKTATTAIACKQSVAGCASSSGSGLEHHDSCDKVVGFKGCRGCPKCCSVACLTLHLFTRRAGTNRSHIAIPSLLETAQRVKGAKNAEKEAA
jgi:hypothetical protein